jgi:hypothetical protein
MIDISKIIHNKNAVNFFSFIIGLGLMVLLFHKPFRYKQFLSIPVADIEGKVVKVDGKCYAYKSEDAKCFDNKN